ncbi:hypothetical protein os4_10120 [Comamonadaceae bacterium OS-4]|nr:hypothetical protein os4_10120 [Comamonadaceae bacterium OS-4]
MKTSKIVCTAVAYVMLALIAWLVLYPLAVYLPVPPTVELTSQLLGYAKPGRGFEIRLGKACTQELTECLNAYIVSGSFSAGSGKKFSKTLDAMRSANPETTLICFDSPGGRMKEASEVARYIKSNGLNTCVSDTYVTDGVSSRQKFTSQCTSACTFAILAGGTRTGLGVRYKFGVHGTKELGGWINSDGPIEERKAKVREQFQHSSQVPKAAFEEILDLAFDVLPDQLYNVAPSEQMAMGYVTVLRGTAQ